MSSKTKTVQPDLNEVADLPAVKIREGLLQRDMERYFAVIERIKYDPKLSIKDNEDKVVMYDGRILRAAIAAHWFEIPTADHVPRIGNPGDAHHKAERFLLGGLEVSEMPPGLVRYYANFVDEAYQEAYHFPKV